MSTFNEQSIILKNNYINRFVITSGVSWSHFNPCNMPSANVNSDQRKSIFSDSIVHLFISVFMSCMKKVTEIVSLGVHRLPKIKLIMLCLLRFVYSNNMYIL